jgi:molybdopterin molybdotransferase
LIARDGGELTGVTHAVGPTALRVFLQDTAAGQQQQVGGSGFGRNDAAVSTLASCGEVHLDGIAMHPGETLVLGEVHGTPVGVLPGTPLATLFAYDAVIGRALRRLAGADGDWPYRRCGLIFTRKVASILGRMEFCRVRMTGKTAEPLAIVKGHVLRTAVRADGFIVIAEELEGYAEGTLVEVLLYGGTR